ncbi:MAG: class I SAM-dependent methyltransferase [Candidatus Omnitrophica bacterium]|nr:class I SAM-dependent methyltransferase [Candidatus Omnitrophota bacterium]
MTAEEENLKIMKNVDNYNKWIYDNIKKHLGKNILEVGGGMGAMTGFLIRDRAVVSTDVSKKHIETLKKRFSGKGYKAQLIDLSETTDSIEGHGFDTAVCINVLEHIGDDMNCLKNMYKLLNDNGKIVLVLPAFPFAFGTIDKSDNHYRRYDKKIIPKLEKIGFKIIKSKYMNLPGLIGWIWHGKILKLQVHKQGDLSLFDKLVPLFAFCERVVPFLPGLSLIVIAEKKGGIEEEKIEKK